MLEPLKYRIEQTALGTTLIFLSMLVETNCQVELLVSSDSILYDLKKIFQIPDTQLLLVTNGKGYELADLSDYGKYFSKYFTVDQVLLFGEKYSTKKRNRPCIGFAIWNDSIPGENNNNQYPHCRYYSVETYSKIFQLAVDAGYDVITLNSRVISLEQKIFILNELCDCIVGYEGGMQHLAHCLGVPSIILPYHTDPSGNRPLYDTDGNLDQNLLYYTHKLHIDYKTYFLNSENEIFDWSPSRFRTIIDNLHNNQGNNILLSGQIGIEPDLLRVFFKEPNGCEDLSPFLTPFEKKFIRTYIPDLKFY